MTLANRIADLASRIGKLIAAKIDANHPGVARAWVNFGVVSGGIVLRARHNVASVTRLATGRYRISFAAPMPDDGYCWTAQVRSSADSGQQRLAVMRASDLKAPEYVEISCATASSSLADSAEINLVVYR